MPVTALRESCAAGQVYEREERVCTTPPVSRHLGERLISVAFASRQAEGARQPKQRRPLPRGWGHTPRKWTAGAAATTAEGEATIETLIL